MKKIIFLLVTALLFTAGCSKKEKKYLPFSSNNTTGAPLQTDSPSTNVTGATLTQIQVTPGDQSIAKNTHANYIAPAVYSDGTTKNISTESTWTVKSETDKVSTVASKKGRFLGSTATSAGTPAKVNATFGSISGDANLNVTSANLSSIQITSIPSLVPGGTAQYVATGIFSDGTKQDISSLVSWSSSATNSVAIDSTTGLGTGGSTAATATITATLITPANFPTVTNGGAATTTTQLKNAKIVSITVTGVASIGAGSTTNYVASAIYDDGTSSDITTQTTWSLSSSANAVISDAQDSKGFFTAVNAGSVNVQATYIGVTGSKAVTINSLTVSSITVSPSTKTIAKGTTTQFTATATYSDGSTADVTKTAVWTSSNTSFGTVDTSSTTGGIARGIAAGAATITAAIGGKSATANLTVTSATLVSISIGNGINSGTGLPASSGPFTVAKGTTKQYYAVGVYSDGTKQDITSLVSWTSGSPSQVNVGNSTGSIGLATGLSQGSSTITASFPNSSGNIVTSNASTLNISAATLTSINIGASTNITAGDKTQYTAMGTFSDASTQDISSLVTWLSGTAANATISNAVSDKGLAYGLVVGTTNITATLANGTNGIVTGGGTVTSNTSVLTISAAATTPATTTPVAISGVTLDVSSGTTTETKPNGAFDGALLIIGDQNTKGFIANITSGTLHNCADVACLMNKILQSISEDDFDFNGTNNTNSILETTVNGGYNLVTRKVVSGTVIPTEIASVEIKVNTTKTLPETGQLAPHSVNDMRNHYVNLVGRVDGSGTITDLPSATSGVATSVTFRIEIQASKNSSSTLIMMGITTTANFDVVEIPLTSLVNGTNIAPSSYSKATGSKNFASSGPPKVDFLISVNNSATMAGEQTGLQTSLASFFARLKSLGTDFRMSVITSDCDKLWRPDTVLRGFASGQHQTCQPTGVGTGEGINDWGSGVNYFDDTKETEFNTTVSKIGIRGWSTETNILYAERAIASGGTFTQVRATNGRSNVPMTVIVISDDPDQYDAARTELTTAGLTAPATIFNKDSNEFIGKATVHAVYPMNTSGNAGYCTGPNGDTQEAPKGGGADAIYPDIIAKTSGMGSTICASNPSAFMELIADQAASGASTYALDHVPITNTLQVLVNGSSIQMGIASLGTTKFIYNSATNKISFTGTIPASGTPITVSYSYYTQSVGSNDLPVNSNLLAYISKTAKSDTARGTAAAIALLVGAILAGRIWKNRKHS
ncbi:MAG: Ig-like domain-containing protein [Leptospiraceae bacterium]|nr:Ig-like domain-containing protein [Leptospiraceae bacterium]